MTEKEQPQETQLPRVALVVLNWNGRELVDSCLATLAGQAYPNYALYVVDNASNDGSAEIIAKRFPDVQLILNTENLGFTRGINIGLKAAFEAGYEIIIALNNDVSAANDWLSRFVAAILDDPKIGVAGCKLLYPDGETIQHAGAMMTIPLAHNHHYFQYEKDAGQADDPRDVDYVTGAALAVRRAVFEKIGFLDEAYRPFYYEEVDFCYRARDAGWRVVYLPQASAVHHESYSVKQLGLNHQAFYQHNRLLFVAKRWSEKRFHQEFVPAETAALKQERSFLTATLVAEAARRQETRWENNPKRPDLAAGFAKIAAAADQAKHRLMPLILPPNPPLQKWEFSSDVPVVGPLIGWLRRRWHNVAARWYTDHAIAQVAQIEAQLAAQNRQLLDLVHGLNHEIASLKKEVARFQANSDVQKEPAETP